MDRYKLGEKLGDGTFGTVWKAVHRESGDVVAIKRMKRKFRAWAECLELREIDSLRQLRHPSLVRLREVVREEELLYLVFEFVGPNLYQVMKDRGRHFPEAAVRSWLRQVLQALAYLHGAGYFHRDIKPENLLVRGDMIKVADLGLVRPVDSGPPYTEYVSTRWYRAPEVLLRSPAYGPPVDLFAVGAVAAELYALKPLFPGGSEADQLACICSVMGSPTEDSWAGGLKLAGQAGFLFVSIQPAPLAALLPTATPAAVHLIESLCAWDHAKRPTAAQALQHPYFQVNVPPPLSSTTALRQRLQAAAAKLAAAAAKRAEERHEAPEGSRQAARGKCAALPAARHPRTHPEQQQQQQQQQQQLEEGSKAEPLKRLVRHVAGRQRAQLRQQGGPSDAKKRHAESGDGLGSPRIGTVVHADKA